MIEMAEEEVKPEKVVNNGSPTKSPTDKQVKDAVQKQIVKRVKTQRGTKGEKTNWTQVNRAIDKVDSDYSQKRLADYMEIYGWNRIDSTNTNEVIKRMNEYFGFCIERKIKPSISSLAIALHTTTATLNHWLKDGAKYNPDLKGLMEEANQIMEAMWEDYMMNGKINPVAGIFLGKNRYGMKDSSDIKIISNNSLDEITNTDEVADKYLKEQSQILDNDEIDNNNKK